MHDIKCDKNNLLFEKRNKLYSYLLFILNIYGIIYILFLNNKNIENNSEFYIPLMLLFFQILLIIGIAVNEYKIKKSIIRNDLYLIFSILTYLIYSLYITDSFDTTMILLFFTFILLNIIVLNKTNVIIIGCLGFFYYVANLIVLLSSENDLGTGYYNRLVLLGIVIYSSLKAIDIFSKYKETIVLQLKDLDEKKEILAKYDSDLANSEKELKDNYEKMFELAYYDKLTNLPNRDYFFEHLINVCLDESCVVDAMIVDIDNFKNINDFYSHDIGDEVLLYVANMLKNVCGSDSIIGRVDGDIFSVILAKDLRYQDVLSKINRLLSVPLSVNEYEINISLSIGVVQFPHDSKMPTDLFTYMELAMYKAKELGKGQYVRYNNELSEEMIKKIDMIGKLKKSLDNREIHLVYQPVFDAITNEPKGFEALVRWNNQVLGYVNPEVFIKLAEETGYIIQLSDWIFREAISFAKKINQGYKKTFVSINLSGVQLQRENLYKYVTNMLAEQQVDPEIIGIEITETSIIEYFDYVVPNLKRLKDLGMRISLDDFGTGYSSLNYLRKLPINTLKIDKTFIDEIFIESKAALVINNLLNLAHELKLDTVAEGVETKEQKDYLMSKNCKFIQGYYMSKPLVDEEAMKILNLTSEET